MSRSTPFSQRLAQAKSLAGPRRSFFAAFEPRASTLGAPVCSTPEVPFGGQVDGDGSCVASPPVQGAPCTTAGGAAGTVSSYGNCVATGAPPPVPGASCTTGGAAGVISPLGICVVPGGACTIAGAAGTYQSDGSCVATPTPVSGAPCAVGGEPGIYAQEAGNSSPNLLCALTNPTSGDSGLNCVLGDTASSTPMSGVFTTPSCIDNTQTSSALYAACVAAGAFDTSACLTLASSRVYPSSANGQPLHAAVANASLCASGYAIPVTLGGLTLLVCAVAPAVGDPCTTPDNLMGKQAMVGGALACVALAGQTCHISATVDGITDASGACVSSSPTKKPGDPCKTVLGQNGTLAADLVTCVAQAPGGGFQVINVNQVVKNAPGGPCFNNGVPGVFNAQLDCVAPNTPLGGHPCTMAGGGAGITNALGACVAVASSESSSAPLIVGGLVVGGILLYLANKK